jgi:hypothetical protein
VAVASIDGRALPAAPGPVTERLRELYATAVRDPEYAVAVAAPTEAEDDRPAA